MAMLSADLEAWGVICKGLAVAFSFTLEFDPGQLLSYNFHDGMRVINKNGEAQISWSVIWLDQFNFAHKPGVRRIFQCLLKTTLTKRIRISLPHLSAGQTLLTTNHGVQG
jgi:hypothetical protein